MAGWFSRSLLWPWARRAVVPHDPSGHAVALSLDPFGRLRVGQLQTLFDSKQIDLHLPAMVFAEKGHGVGGGTITYNSLRSSTILQATTNGDELTRQTRRYWNYQPGKGQLIKMTQVVDVPAEVTAEARYGDARNGFALRWRGQALSLVRRSDVTGSVVETEIHQADWNRDRFDGTGGDRNRSRVQIDPNAANIFFVAMAWLGVGDVAVGFQVGDHLVVAHVWEHANVVQSVYMRTPDLPVGWYCSADSAPSVAGTVEAICCTVGSESGQEALGVPRTDWTRTAVTCAADTFTELMAGRLKSSGSPPVAVTHTTAFPVNGWVANASNAEGVFLLVYRPYGMSYTAGTANWRAPLGLDSTSHVQIHEGATTPRTQAVTGTYPELGHIIASGVLAPKGGLEFDIGKLIALGTDVDGHPDELVVMAGIDGPGGSISCGINWIELI